MRVIWCLNLAEIGEKVWILQDFEFFVKSTFSHQRRDFLDWARILYTNEINIQVKGECIVTFPVKSEIQRVFCIVISDETKI